MTTSLPANLQIKAGTFRAQFGRNNTQHLHVQNFTRRPLMTSLLFGADGFRGPGRAGVDAAAASLVRDAVRRRRSASVAPEDTAIVATFGGGARATPKNLTYTAVLEQFWELGEETSILLGANFATGRAFDCMQAVPCDAAIAVGPRSYLYGGDLYVKWKPANTSRTYRSLQWTTEFFARTLASGGPTEGAGYTEPVVQIARRFLIGARFDLTGLPSGPSVPRRYGYAGVADVHAQRVFALAALRAGADRTRGQVGHGRLPPGRVLDGRARRAPVLGDEPCETSIKTVIVAAAVVLGLGGRAEAKLRVVASIETLADLSRQVGGDRVDVTSLSRGYQDPHFVEAKPSLVLALNRADALVYVGLDLEVGLAAAAGAAVAQRAASSAGSRATSTRRRRSAPRTSRTCRPISCARSGDIHPLGNPHYWIPPKNARAIARLLAERFTALDAGGRGHVQGRARALRGAAGGEGEGMGGRRGAAARARAIVTFHKSWSYVAHWLGLEEVGYIEPKPGIPPTANHTAQLVELMKKNGVRLVIVESFYPSTMARSSPTTARRGWSLRRRTSARRPRSRPTSTWSTR